MSKYVDIQTATGGYIVETKTIPGSNDKGMEHEMIVCKDLQDVLGTVVAFFARPGEQYRIERVGENGEDHER